MLPLVPGYLSYVTGLAGADLEGSAKKGAPGAPLDTAGQRDGGAVAVRERIARVGAVKGRVLAGTLLFIAGFTVVFVATAILFAGIGRVFFDYKRELQIGVGALIIVLGLGYLGMIPGPAARVPDLPTAVGRAARRTGARAQADRERPHAAQEHARGVRQR